MVYTCTYPSPLGNILLAADEVGLTGLWFEGQKYFANTLPKETVSQEIPVLIRAKKMAGCLFFRERTGLYPSASSCRFNLSSGCVADSAADSLWTDYDIWGDCKKNDPDA